MQNMLQAGLIVAGWDKVEGGSVFAVPLGGTLVKVPFSIGQPACMLVDSLTATRSLSAFCARLHLPLGADHTRLGLPYSQVMGTVLQAADASPGYRCASFPNSDVSRV